MILSRTDFAVYFNTIQPGLGDDDSPLWIPEEGLVMNQSHWFCSIRPIVDTIDKAEFHQWNREHLQGKVRCYSSNSDDKIEWWGFNDYNDILIWMLKWS